MQMSECECVQAVVASSAFTPTPAQLLYLLLPFKKAKCLGQT